MSFFSQRALISTAAVVAALLLLSRLATAQVPAADAKSEAIVVAAKAFLATLSDQQRKAALYDFTDNAQRANWSNLPNGNVRRGGVMRGDLSAAQNAAMDSLLGELLSEDGTRNVILQLHAEDALERSMFSSDFYFASFLGEPSTTYPWMFQFGGHHLAINATVFGPHVSFAPMLTGGQPMYIRYEGEDLFIAQRETDAAQAFMDSLSDAQAALAVRGPRAINLLLGPGKDGTILAPEGIKGSELTAEQKTLLLDVIRARAGFINDDDFATKMATVEVEIDDTYFGWWGPRDAQRAAYFRVTGPSLVLEYAPQGSRGGQMDHVHSMYREPGNDYGAEWIGTE